jgi:thiol-disulfide isomerase/thioredoxin
MKMKGTTVALAALLAFCLIFASSAGAEETEEPLPEFTFTAVDGKTLESGELKENPLVIVMMASWCPPCKREAPELEKAHLAYKDRGVRFLGVFVASSEKSIAKFADKYGLTFPVGTAEGDLNDLFGWKPFPAAAFVAPGGVVRIKHFGETDFEELSEGIEKILE